ncbi:hypothetical protein VBD025_12670 [Virgibacillus flavescens]|uniref:hypothetical protein n=1 Tax=Virgibacillus flavescens TaxID=1611422 RepID=UPI003D353F41
MKNTTPNPVIYTELYGADHNFDMFHSIRKEVIINGIEAFADWVLKDKKSK